MNYFETEEDRLREQKAISRFISLFEGGYEKLGINDIDYKVFDSNKKLIAYAEVKGRLKNISTAYPLPIAARKLVKLMDKRLNPILIWACDDGIIYAKLKDIVGTAKVNGRLSREGSSNDEEVMVYYDKQKAFKYVRYV